MLPTTPLCPEASGGQDTHAAPSCRDGAKSGMAGHRLVAGDRGTVKLGWGGRNCPLWMECKAGSCEMTHPNMHPSSGGKRKTLKTQ